VVARGRLARLSAQHLAEQGAAVVVLNRTPARGEALAREVGGTARPLEALEDELRRADVVVFAAPVAPGAFRPEAFAATMRARRRRIVLVDLAVPRAIPAATGSIEDVYLCDVDDLDRVMRASLDERAQSAGEAERIVAEEVARWARSAAERRAAPLIQEIRSRASAIAREEVERTLRRAACDGGEGEALVAAAARSFDLPPDDRARSTGAA